MKRNEYGYPTVLALSPLSLRSQEDMLKEALATKKEICQDKDAFEEARAVFEREVALLTELERKRKEQLLNPR
jgi:hypothetical protein